MQTKPTVLCGDVSLGYRSWLTRLKEIREPYITKVLTSNGAIGEVIRELLACCAMPAPRKCYNEQAKLESFSNPLTFAFDRIFSQRRRARATAISSRNRAGRFSSLRRGGRTGLRYSNLSVGSWEQRDAKTRRPKLAAVTLVFAVSVGFSKPVDANPVDQYPGRWINHDYIVELNDMPQTYTCQDLWFKFRDTLHAIGARSTDIIPYHCAKTAATWERSPRVRMTFQLPDRLQKQQMRWAAFKLIERSVEIAPGALPSLSAEDCQLVQRVNAELILPLGISVVKSQFKCAGSHPTFDLLLTANAAAPSKSVAAH